MKINGIDVSECNAYKDKHCKNETSIMFTEYNLCSKFPNCYFKQFKRLQEENEELKKLKCKFKEYCTCDIEKYRSALEEIREIAKKATNSKDCYIYTCTQEECTANQY